MRSTIQAVATALCLAPAVLAMPWTGQEQQCSPRVVSLATGIHLNIIGQGGELSATETLQAIESASPVNETAFYIYKGELLADIAAGIKIREYNQEIAPQGNAALPGLAEYATAQATEQGLAESLTGDPSVDLTTLATIHSDIVSGTELNERNLAAAVESCQLGFQFPAYPS